MLPVHDARREPTPYPLAVEAGTVNKLVVNADLGDVTISRHIQGHFAEHLGRCIYEGIWVGVDSPIPNTRGMRDDVLDALRALKMPNVRWPGGCFADTYHWMDGIGRSIDRPSMVNVHWGGVTENNHFGTHEFFDFCELVGTEPYVCGNVGSGSVREMAEWVEYITMPGASPMSDLRRDNGRAEPWPLKYWAVGNENWGCGGNMRPEYYADLYRQYACFLRHFGGDKLYKVACGHTDEWNRVLVDRCHQHMDGISIHYYTSEGGWNKKGSATEFDEAGWFAMLRGGSLVEPFIRKTAGILDAYDPAGRIGIILDEWGSWYNVEPGTNPGFLYQQNTMRDALLAGLSLNIFNAWAKRLHMANIAQTINVLQAMILTEGGRMVRTPTYHVFEMYNVHQDATLVPISLDCAKYEMNGQSIAQVSASASRRADGVLHLTLCNLHHADSADLAIDLRGLAAQSVSGRILVGDRIQAHNTFDQPDQVVPVAFDGARLSSDGLLVQLPAASVVVLAIS
ncbi:MAG: alpha-N-arabinofuranosidase [Armatimonadetes bacterium]|nr:alpha-N-arabinofuranosidase [Armatimonadota bacterium]